MKKKSFIFFFKLILWTYYAIFRQIRDYIIKTVLNIWQHCQKRHFKWMPSILPPGNVGSSYFHYAALSQEALPGFVRSMLLLIGVDAASLVMSAIFLKCQCNINFLQVNQRQFKYILWWLLLSGAFASSCPTQLFMLPRKTNADQLTQSIFLLTFYSFGLFKTKGSEKKVTEENNNQRYFVTKNSSLDTTMFVGEALPYQITANRHYCRQYTGAVALPNSGTIQIFARHTITEI